MDSIKKAPFHDDGLEDADSLADYTEGYGDMEQYGTNDNNRKETNNGHTVC